ncbi:zinc ribbon domain-containing protein [Desulfallas sp. Bu1-1]|uniref:FmdB family zinc ribbon protein n=1 Tax=Desulfallas sp. Bu1-1 TaxID=2787620 RepID=UPI00189F4AAE|nr:zinc ribbon domain-containing protein [Desulfallas sp. Bu1-1]MBF7082152.1 zinc ribbon domain-containing protein [Desulfallas sp. Bu1-1]
MPTYDFRCGQCGHKFTVLVSISEKDKVTCPACGAGKIEQLFTGCAVRTGGGGGSCDLPAAGGGFGGG